MPSLNVLGFVGSPRKKSNTRVLLDRVLEGAQSQGATVNLIDLCKVRIAPCIACDGCYTHDRCVVQDDFQEVFDQLIVADRIVLATPIYFMNVSAQSKCFIDRCQCLWARKYIQKLPLSLPQAGGKRQGHLISVGGSGLKNLFDCAQKTFRFFLDTLDAEVGTPLLYSQVDARGEIQQHPEAFDEAFLLGQNLGSSHKV